MPISRNMITKNRSILPAPAAGPPRSLIVRLQIRPPPPKPPPPKPQFEPQLEPQLEPELEPPLEPQLEPQLEPIFEPLSFKESMDLVLEPDDPDYDILQALFPDANDSGSDDDDSAHFRKKLRSLPGWSKDQNNYTYPPIDAQPTHTEQLSDLVKSIAAAREINTKPESKNGLNDDGENDSDGGDDRSEGITVYSASDKEAWAPLTHEQENLFESWTNIDWSSVDPIPMWAAPLASVEKPVDPASWIEHTGGLPYPSAEPSYQYPKDGQAIHPARKPVYDYVSEESIFSTAFGEIEESRRASQGTLPNQPGDCVYGLGDFRI